MRKTLAFLLLLSCGTPGPHADCHGTVSGQVKGSFSVCNDYDNLYLQNMDAFNFSADYTELPTVFTFSTAWTIPQEPVAKTYTDNTMGIDCTITVQKGKQTWKAHQGAGSVASGNCVLDFTVLADGGVNDAGVVSLGMQGNTEAFKLSGELRGHLEAVPNTGSTGTVDVTMDFDG
jgi:hypothetical protein